MRFADSFLDEIRARLPVSEVVRRRVQLKKQGREWRGLSPFNKERTPSFYVNDQKGFYHDFSSGKHGDIFTFLMDTEGLSFPESVERLANLAGVPMPVASPEAEAREARHRTLYEVMELATGFFEKMLAAPVGAKARGYLADRAVLPETQREFRIGYAPGERFALKEFLGSHGVPVPAMVEAGLLIAGDDIPVPYDRFRDRVMIPIHDQRGRVIAFGGRTLNNEVQPKYLNSPDTSLFHKGACVFNFHRARQPAHDDNSVVVVEGYMDAIAIYQAGMKSVVASMGTAFTEEQISLLWRLSAEPVVCFDADAAGIKAAYRSLDRILPELKVGRTFRFAAMTGGKDPDDLIRASGLNAFKNVLSGSLPLWDVLWERETSQTAVATPDEQAALEHKLKSIIGNIKDTTVRVAYERTCRLELASFFWQITKAKRGNEPSKKIPLHIEKDGHRHGHQKIILGMLVHYPEFLEDKSHELWGVHFSPELDDFCRALVNLLISGAKISVLLIYKELKPTFYKVLEDIHGERTGSRPWGYRLLQRFPVLTRNPPHEFISRCIDHFIKLLRVEQMKDHIEELQKEAYTSDQASIQLLELVRDFHTQKEAVRHEESQLADEVKEIRKPWSPTESTTTLVEVA